MWLSPPAAGPKRALGPSRSPLTPYHAQEIATANFAEPLKGEVRRMEDLHLATAMCIGLRRSSSPHKTSVGISMFGSRLVVSVSAEDFAIRRKPSGPGQALPGRQEGRLRRVGRSSRWARRKKKAGQ